MENGCWFAAILKGKNKIYGFANRDNIEKINDSHILLLPWMKKKSIYEPYYYIINDEWKERTREGTFMFNKIDENLFNDWM